LFINGAILQRIVLTYNKKSTNNHQTNFKKMFPNWPVLIRLSFILPYIFGFNQSTNNLSRPIRLLTNGRNCPIRMKHRQRLPWQRIFLVSTVLILSWPNGTPIPC